MTGGGSGGGSGFLFGNIDKRGRLDEDYLEDEAKDNIENVGTTVTEQNADLAQIHRELPGSKAPGDNSDDDDYDDNDKDRVDYGSEKEEMDIDEAERVRLEEEADAAERARMADIALAPNKRGADDDEDEDYDEDDEPADGTKKPADGDGTAKKTPAPSPKPKADNAALLQMRLLQDARLGREGGKQKEKTLEHNADDPRKFSEIFALPVKRLTAEDFNYSKQRVYGVRVENDVPTTSTVIDDNEALLKSAPTPKANPDEYFLEMDRQKVLAAREAVEERDGKDKAPMEDDAEIPVPAEEDNDYEDDACLPLDPTAKPLKPVPESVHDPIMQVNWEKDIIVDDDYDSDEEKEAEMLLDNSPEAQDDVENEAPSVKPLKSALQVLTPLSNGKTNGTPADDDSDDDMEWEDGGDGGSSVNAAKPNPLKTPTAPSNPIIPRSAPNPIIRSAPSSASATVINSKPASTPNGADADDSDSDDMEWEDGDKAGAAPTPAPKPAAALPPSTTGPPGPGPLIPLSGAAAAVPLKKIIPGKSNTPARSVPASAPAPSKAAPSNSNSSKPAIPASKPPLAPMKGKPGTGNGNTTGKGKGKGAGPGKGGGKGKGPGKGKGTGKGKGKKGPGKGNGKKGAKAAENAEKKVTFEEPQKKQVETVPKPPEILASAFIRQNLCPNRAFANGSWVHDIIWDADSNDPEGELEPGSRRNGRLRPSPSPLRQLILDPNDPNLIFETVKMTSKADTKMNMTVAADTNTKNRALRRNSVPRLPLTDPFNISNDYYYSSGAASNSLKVNHRALLRGLNNAPPAVKCQTTRHCNPEPILLAWHKPKIPKEFITKHPVELTPFRRRRPKGGSAQIAGQIPKKRGELFCSSKDAYRVALFEYSLEKQPCLLPVPGTASRILTYDRKTSAAEAAQATKNAAGTPEADNVFMSPDEIPPLHAGDLLAEDPPLSTVESHLFVAPCAQVDVPSTDFLVMRRGGKMQVREIDSVVSIGVTEPKLEVMAPNTDRFKKYGKERVSLFIVREFLKQRKKEQDGKNILTVTPSIDKEAIFREFFRRRSFPETALIKQLKELCRYGAGKYVLHSEPAKGFSNREAEILRTCTAEETSAFESMEAGWEKLINFGIQTFTHPTSQGNVLTAATNCGFKCGPVVGAFIKNQLLETPWYKSSVICQSQKQQKKEMVHALTLARIVKDLKEGGAVMEARMMDLSAGDLQRVLINHFKVLARKVPNDTEERRSLLREHAMKKNKTAEVQEYPQIIESIIQKHRNLGNRAGITAQTAASHSATHVIALSIQRAALERGIVEDLPTELERTNAVEIYEDISKPVDDAFDRKKKKSNDNGTADKKDNKGTGKKNAKPINSKRKPQSDNNAASKRPKIADDGDELEQLKKLTHSSAVLGGPKLKIKIPAAPGKLPKPPAKSTAGSSDMANLVPLTGVKTGNGGADKKKAAASSGGAGNSGSSAGAKPKKLPPRLRITKNVKDAKGNKRRETVVVTDPKEIQKILDEQEAKKNKKANKASSSGDGFKSAKAGASSSQLLPGKPLKVAINLRDLQKLGPKKKPSPSVERKKAPDSEKATKKRSRDEGSKDPTTVRKPGVDGGVGKIRINKKAIRKEVDEAAQKRIKAQYGDEDYGRSRKHTKSGLTSRKKRNGAIQLNGILENIEKRIRSTEGYIEQLVPTIRIARVRRDTRLPDGVVPKNLATPAGTALDFTQPVNLKQVPRYAQIVKKPMDLGTIRQKCKQMKYQSANEFLNDVQQIARNAKVFNTTADVNWVVQHAVLLGEVAEEEINNRRADINPAEEAIVKQKRAEDKGGPSGNGNSENGGSSKKKQEKVEGPLSRLGGGSSRRNSNSGSRSGNGNGNSNSNSTPIDLTRDDR